MRKIGISDFSQNVTKPTNYYNLDVIISVGYRVNEKYQVNTLSPVEKAYLENIKATEKNVKKAVKESSKTAFFNYLSTSNTSTSNTKE